MSVGSNTAGGNTVVGSAVVVNGRVHGATDITIHGRVEGRVELAATLIVGTAAVLKADLQVKRVIVFGTVVGTIHASEAVDLRAGARVVGDVIAPQLLMEDGALYKGNVYTPDMAPKIARPASNPPPPAKEISRAPVAGRPQPRVLPRPATTPPELAPSLPPVVDAPLVAAPRARTAPPPVDEPRPAVSRARRRVGQVRPRPQDAAPTSAPPATASPELPAAGAPPTPRPLPGRGSGARVQVKRRG